MIPATADGGGNLEVSQPEGSEGRQESKIGTGEPNKDLGLCLTPDSLIYLSDGAKKPLIEIKQGDLVLSLNQTTGRLEPHRVNALLDMGVKPVYKLTTQSGKTLKTTLNHPYLTRNGWKKLKDIKAGEEIAVAEKLVGLSPQRYPGNQNIVSLPIKDNSIVSGSEAINLASFAFDIISIMQGIGSREIKPYFIDNEFLDRNGEFTQLPVGMIGEGIANHLIPNRCSIVLEETRPDWRDFSISSQNSGLEYSIDSNKSIKASLSKKKPLVFKPSLSETNRTNPLSAFWGLWQSCDSFTTLSFNNNDDITIFTPPFFNVAALLLPKLYHKLTEVSNLFQREKRIDSHKLLG